MRGWMGAFNADHAAAELSSRHMTPTSFDVLLALPLSRRMTRSYICPCQLESIHQHFFSDCLVAYRLLWKMFSNEGINDTTQ